MTKEQMILKRMDYDREQMILNKKKREYIEYLLKVEEQIRNKWTIFANTFLTKEVFETLKKIYETPSTEYYIGFCGLPDNNGKPIKFCINYYNSEENSVSFEVTDSDNHYATKSFSLKELYEGYCPLIHKEDLILPEDKICPDYLLQVTANKLKKYETTLKLLENNIQFFYEEICQRINSRLQGQEEFLSNLPKFETTTTQKTQYKVIIKIEEI